MCRAINNACASGSRLVRDDRPASGRPQLQHERLQALRLLEAVDCHDVSMVERREQLRLSFEAGEAVGIEPEGSDGTLSATSRFGLVSRDR